jgi:hypothetical protein
MESRVGWVNVRPEQPRCSPEMGPVRYDDVNRAACRRTYAVPTANRILREVEGFRISIDERWCAASLGSAIVVAF